MNFGEDIDGEKVILISSKDYASIRKTASWCPASDIAASLILGGVVGMIHGCQVVVSNRVSAGKAYIVKPGALAIYLKRDALVETDRDIITKETVITADKHLAVYLVDNTKAITIA